MSVAKSKALDAAAARNHLLAALPPDELCRVAPALEPVHCETGTILRAEGAPADQVFFPATCVAASFYTLHDGTTVEHGLVGCDGLVGVAAFLGGGPAPGRVDVVIGGDALRMPAAALVTEFRRGGALQRVLLRYTHALIVQSSLESVCRTHHAVEQRLARLLLQVADLGSGEDLPLTQESLGMLLGVRRETVNHATSHLQEQGWITHERGRVLVLDVEQLRKAACGCGRAVAGRPMPAYQDRRP
jgi:CRP-like cAMP-binding protein